MAQKDMSQVCQPQIGECLEGGVETQKGETERADTVWGLKLNH